MMFYIILVSKIWYPYKNDPLEHSGTKGTLQGIIIFIFFFNQRQLDACDVEAFRKVTFYPKKTIQPVTTYSEEAMQLIQFKIG